MIDKKLVFAIIPARGGSKGIKKKNLKKIGNKSLLKHAIDCAKKSKYIDKIIVSSDDKEIINEAKKNKTEIHFRNKILSSDNSPVIKTIKNIWAQKRNSALNSIFVLLEPTSPFRSSDLVDKCIKRLIHENLDSIATFSEAKSNPERLWMINKLNPKHFYNDKIVWKQRQNLKSYYELNGQVYCFYPEKLPKKENNILFGKKSAEIVSNKGIIDIDDYFDLFLANAVFKSRKFTIN